MPFGALIPQASDFSAHTVNYCECHFHESGQGYILEVRVGIALKEINLSVMIHPAEENSLWWWFSRVPIGKSWTGSTSHGSLTGALQAVRVWAWELPEAVTGTGGFTRKLMKLHHQRFSLCRAPSQTLEGCLAMYLHGSMFFKTCRVKYFCIIFLKESFKILSISFPTKTVSVLILRLSMLGFCYF